MEGKCSVYARNGKVFVRLADSFGSEKRGAGYPIGSNIIAFIRLDFKSGIDKLFTDYIRLVFNIDLCVTEEDYFRQKKELAEEYILKMPFLYFAFKTLQDCLDDYIDRKDFNGRMADVPNYDKFNRLFAERYEEEPQKLYSEFSSVIDQKVFKKFSKAEVWEECIRYHLFLCLKDALICNLEETQKIFREEMMYLYQREKSETADSLTPKQRLYVYDRHRNKTTGRPMFYVNVSRSVKTLAYTEHNPSSDEPGNINGLAEYVKENDVDLLDVQEIVSFDELMRFEMLRLVESDTVISKCENCGNLFIPRGRKDMLFCNVIVPELGKTCAEVGAHRKYNEKVKVDAVFNAFNKAYKRNNSRVRNKKMTVPEFSIWSEQAREKRELCVKGEISVEEYNAWLGNK